MSLKNYLKKRNLKKSKEPSGNTKKKKKEKNLFFVVQKHAARRLHYDFRLEMKGVLKSWAVPKGPSMDPSDKRLAIHVEDHPLEYGNFEGIIPKGEYGAGKVEIWDKGTYTSSDSKTDEKKLEKQLKAGEIKLILHGEKLKGEFTLVKFKNKEENQWLLIKKKDAFSLKDDRIEEQKDDAVIEEMGVKRKIPHHISPMLATLIEKPFDSNEWIFEIKWDGYRALSEITPKNVSLYSRNLHSFNENFPSIVKELQSFKKSMVLDGEIVVLNKKGKAEFQLLQRYLKTKEKEGLLRYYVFDILYYEGHDLRDLPLIERKTLLKQVIDSFTLSHIFYQDHIQEKGLDFFNEIKKENIEGIIAKHRESKYVSKRSDEWLKIKAKKKMEAVIAGFTQSRGKRKIGALLLGVYEKKNFTFVGHTGGGLDEKIIQDLYKELKPFIVDKSPFVKTPETNMPATWVKPKLVCEVEFQNWTESGVMRQPIFKGLRIDKKPKEVHKEQSISKTFLLKKKSVYKEDFISNPKKIYWPKEKYTKGDLIEYYEEVSSFILPYLKNRPEVLHRFPDGIEGKEFYQKKSPDFIPDWMQVASIEHSDKTISYLLIQDKKSLLYVVNLGCIELHPFASQISSLDFPDYLILDLDPQEIAFSEVVQVAKILHELLEDIDLPHFCKTSGKRGLHILVPLGKKYTFDQAEQFAKLLVKIAHDRLPETTSLIRDPKKRKKKIYLDYLQNSRTKTIVAPYSVRPVPKATVSMPIFWKELTKDLHPADFTIENTLERLKKKGDPFQPLLKQKINMEVAIKKLEKFTKT